MDLNNKMIKLQVNRNYCSSCCGFAESISFVTELLSTLHRNSDVRSAFVSRTLIKFSISFPRTETPDGVRTQVSLHHFISWCWIWRLSTGFCSPGGCVTLVPTSFWVMALDLFFLLFPTFHYCSSIVEFLLWYQKAIWVWKNVQELYENDYVIRFNFFIRYIILYVCRSVSNIVYVFISITISL